MRSLIKPHDTLYSPRRRGGREAEGGGLLSLPRLIRFNLPNNLQMGARPSNGVVAPHSGGFAPHFAPHFFAESLCAVLGFISRGWSCRVETRPIQ
jgi:hypothetical protein